ncbi:unnamed protein product, partial [Urochloa humidicola]
DTNERKQFVQTYLSSSESEAEEVENLIKSIEKYTLASHLVWGLWGIISVGFSHADSITHVTCKPEHHVCYPLKTQPSGCRTMSMISTSTIRNTRDKGSSSTG